MQQRPAMHKPNKISGGITMSNTNKNPNTSGNSAPVFSDSDFDGRIYTPEPYESSAETDPEIEVAILSGLEAFGIV